MINFKNTTENLIIVIIVMVISGFTGGYIGYQSASKSTLKTLSAQQPLIEMAIQKNTSEIQNVFQNEFKKIKNKKGEPINIVIDPSTKSIITSDTNQVVKVEEKKGFFKQFFHKKR